MAKEELKPNVVTAPTLFIGVGGTGCSIVKQVGDMCHPEELKNINFVCLDTNVNDLNQVKDGKNVYYVQTSNTQTVGDYLYYDTDARREWFPKSAVIYDKTVSEGAGQVRAISRLAFNSTIKVGRIEPLHDAIDNLFRKDGKELKQALRVVIASTASGGTGSGIILPLAMYIRDYVKTKYPNTSLIVRSLILLPETLDSVITSSAEKESQYRNAYATIKEINAFMMKGSGFLDVDEDLKRYSNLHVDFDLPGTKEKKRLSLLPFDFCFLLDGQDAQDTTLVSFDQYKKQAARALYEQNIGPMQGNAFSVEDNIIKELSNPGNYGRNRFGGIGAGAIVYPYESIADYVAYDWAKDSIGGEGEAAKWSKYDNIFKIKKLEARKKGLSESESPRLGAVYVESIDTRSDNFTKDLRNTYIQGRGGQVDSFIAALDREIASTVRKNKLIADPLNQATSMGLDKEITYDEDKRGKATENLDILRSFENSVRNNAKKVGDSFAEGVLYNEEGKTINEKREYTLEYLMKNSYGEVAHPNIMRYFLYKVEDQFKNKARNLKSEEEDVLKKLDMYQTGEDGDDFDVKGIKAHLADIDALCNAEKEDVTLRDKLSGYIHIYDKLNEHFPKYFKLIEKLMDIQSQLPVYQKGIDYVADLNRNFEKFYSGFEGKVKDLVRRQDDLAETLRFRKGDSVLNVCSAPEILKEVSLMTTAKSNKGSMLDSELNAQIFDAIKKNVKFERETRTSDVVEEDQRVDIFDEILFGYFRNQVRKECEELDKNIIEAIALEYQMMARIKAKESAQGDEKVYDRVDPAEKERYILGILSMGERLSAPGIQRLTNEEPREVKLCAYNKSLTYMKNYPIKNYVPNGKEVDTISKYELHYFNALYNLTPDKLSKFAAPNQTETMFKGAGIYQRAYMDYAKKIGPDSTKNASISTHIDKRWDSLSVMPEIDLRYQSDRIMKVHKALIYGLLHKKISYKKYSNSPHVMNSPVVYRYENTEERNMDLLVSNGTLCDEFYEILDSLYISSAVVEDIESMREKAREKDETRNSNFEETTFFQDLSDFKIAILQKDEAGNGYDSVNSLFEIPVEYCNSLPNSQRFNGEIAALVQAVIETLKEELFRWEMGDDVKFILAHYMERQFMRLIANFRSNPKLSKKSSKPADSEVIDIIFRKIKNEIEQVPEPENCATMIEDMRKAITCEDKDFFSLEPKTHIEKYKGHKVSVISRNETGEAFYTNPHFQNVDKELWTEIRETRKENEKEVNGQDAMSKEEETTKIEEEIARKIVK